MIDRGWIPGISVQRQGRNYSHLRRIQVFGATEKAQHAFFSSDDSNSNSWIVEVKELLLV
jgi:cytochrome oxidase assembly protein ShyY1